MAMQINAVPGQAVTVDCDPGGWPFAVTVGGTEVKAWPEKYRSARGIRARLHFNVPQLGRGTHQIVVRDKSGPKLVGTVIV